MSNSPIGFLDSGFGGLSIYKSVIHLLPKESTIYIGDHAYIPYGEKTQRFIRNRIEKLITYLLRHKVKLVILACNTATIAGIDQYRKKFPQIPIIGVVPVVKTAAEKSKRHSFAILSTEFTARSAYQKNLIKKFASSCHVYNLGCSNLTSFVEKGITKGPTIAREMRTLLTPKIRSEIDYLVLGCTHYPFLRKQIQTIVGPAIRILDSGGAVARHTARILLHNKIKNNKQTNKHVFYSTSGDTLLSSYATKLLRKKITVTYAHI